MSRPSKQTPEVEEAIIDGLMSGLSLVKVCDAEDMPNRRTVLRWFDADEAFAAKCARARTMQADLMDDRILDLIDNVTPESAQADRVKLAGLQWRAAKLAPKKYGDKVTLGGDADNPVKTVLEISWKKSPSASRSITSHESDSKPSMIEHSDLPQSLRIVGQGKP